VVFEEGKKEHGQRRKVVLVLRVSELSTDAMDRRCEERRKRSGKVKVVVGSKDESTEEKKKNRGWTVYMLLPTLTLTPNFSRYKFR
jgi:hypothetical protein